MLEKAQSRKNVLTRYTMEVRKKELEAAVQKARADEQVRHTKWEHEAQNEKRLNDLRIIVAPIAGRLRYRKEPDRTIDSGATVHYQQELFRIDPETGSSPNDRKATLPLTGEDAAPNPRP